MSFRRQIDETSVLAVSILSFSAMETYSKLFWYNAESCNFDGIDVITDFGSIGTMSFGNIARMQINRNNDKFYFLQNNTNRDYNANIYN